MEQDFHGDFQVIVTWFFASFSGVLDWIVLLLVWFERSLHSTQVTEESCPWTLKLMTSQRVERTWIRTGGYRWFRGEWVNEPAIPVCEKWNRIKHIWQINYLLSRFFHKTNGLRKKQRRVNQEENISRFSKAIGQWNSPVFLSDV